MAELKNKIVTVESLAALHDYDESAFAKKSHTHTKSQITDFPVSLKNPNTLTIQGNGTTLTNGTYDGSAAKTVNITPSSIGAADSSHSHSYLPLSGGTITGKTTLNDLLLFSNSDKGIQAKHPTNGNLYHQFQPINLNGNCTIGYGLYEAGLGSTDVFGQKVELKSKSNIVLTGNIKVTSTQAGLTDSPYGVNQVLWSGTSYVESDVTLTLDKKVSEMPHGIVLVFSGYTVGSGAQNSHWHYFFVPKYVVGIDNGGGSSFTLLKGGKMYTKYIYINDQNLTGNADNNNSSYSLHGQTVDNRNFVLRYVIGV